MYCVLCESWLFKFINKTKKKKKVVRLGVAERDPKTNEILRDLWRHSILW